jgi:cellulose biosynthesis protein BcsQ
MKTIALYNLKGGVGKTTVAVNLACLAAADGAGVLLWDLDPQGAAGWSLRAGRRRGGGARRLLAGRADPATLAAPTDVPGLSIIASRRSYRRLDTLLCGGGGGRRTLRRLLEPLDGAYDWLFLDCPPGMSRLAENIVRAADCVLVPVVPSPLGVRSWESLVVFLARQGIDTRVAVPFVSMLERSRRAHSDAVRELRDREPRLCQAMIPRRADIETTARRPFVLRHPRSPGTRAFDALWEEVKAHVARESAPAVT